MSDWIEHLTDNIEAAEDAKQRRRDWLALRSEILKSKAHPAWKNVVAACEEDVHKINQKLTEKFPGDQSKSLTFECSRSRQFVIRRAYSPSFHRRASENLLGASQGSTEVPPTRRKGESLSPEPPSFRRPAGNLTPCAVVRLR